CTRFAVSAQSRMIRPICPKISGVFSRSNETMPRTRIRCRAQSRYPPKPVATELKLPFAERCPNDAAQAIGLCSCLCNCLRNSAFVSAGGATNAGFGDRAGRRAAADHVQRELERRSKPAERWSGGSNICHLSRAERRSAVVDRDPECRDGRTG